MASSSQSANIVGRVGQDPSKQSEKAPVTFSVAVDQGYADKKRTNWWKVKVWGKEGEYVLESIRKGDVVAASGDLELDMWQKGGETTVTPTITCQKVVLCASKGERPARAPQQETQQSTSWVTDPNDDISF